MSTEFLFIITVAYTQDSQLQLSQRHVWATDLSQELVQEALAEMLNRVPNANGVQTLFTVIPEAVNKTVSNPQ